MLPFRASALLLAVLMTGSPASSQTFQESFESADALSTGLDDILLLGQDGSWVGRVSEGAYLITNETDSGAVQFFYFGSRNQGRVPEVAVDVSGRYGDEGSGAGILYRFDPEARTYFAFTLTRDGYAVWKRSADGFHRIVGGSSEVLRQPGAKRLRARSSDGQTEFLINDERIASLSSSDIGGSQAGLIAMSIGEFRFDNLSLSMEEPSAAPASTPAPVQAPPTIPQQPAENAPPPLPD